MEEALFLPCTAFSGTKRLATGPLVEVALAVKNAQESDATCQVLVFDDRSAHLIDLDLRGSKKDVISRLPEIVANASRVEQPAAPGPAHTGQRGRPKLGVVGREVTLLPRHWQWLDAQPGGASVALRKLVEQARHTSGDRDRAKAATEAAYRFVTAMAGDLPGYEESIRALFAGDRRTFTERIAHWPEDIREYAVNLAFAADQPAATD